MKYRIKDYYNGIYHEYTPLKTKWGIFWTEIPRNSDNLGTRYGPYQLDNGYKICENIIETHIYKVETNKNAYIKYIDWTK